MAPNLILKSRHYPSPESFVDDFLTTLTPGVIPRVDFIKWSTIKEKMNKLTPFVRFYTALQEQIRQGVEFKKEIADALLACDDPYPYIWCAFELLGHTDKELVTQKDDLNLSNIATQIQSGNENAAYQLSELLQELGFEQILKRTDLEDVLFGVQIRLETHRRKNIDGKFFKEKIKQILKNIAKTVADKVGKNIEVSEEVKLSYGNGLSKKVDFAIIVNGENKFGIEVNFYTVPGSKPTEIKRSYGDIRQGLLTIGVDLIWITDGKGYRRMKRSLRDAYIILPNIYNFYQTKEYLAADLVTCLTI